MLRFIIFLTAFSLCEMIISAQDNDHLSLGNHVFSNNIKTVQLFKEGWNLSNPVIRLNGNEKLNLHFDLLKEQRETFYYTLIHCTKDWQKTDIFQNDYIDGFSENDIENIKPSFNTSVHYNHYSLVFPNDKVRLKLSGNYILMVYPQGDPENPVITHRFVVTEDAAKIDVNVHRPQMTSDNNAMQQVDFTVNIAGLEINDARRYIYASILQNWRWETSRNDLRPDIYGNNELKYSSISGKNIFPGGNEFRYFDIKSLKYQSEFIKRIDFQGNSYHIFLHPSENREFKPYFYSKDFNGKYFIAAAEGRNPDIDADYVYVYFTIPSMYPEQDGEVFINGALTDWTFSNSNMAWYNEEKRQYECSLLLKQGWYNYEYAVAPKEGTQPAGARYEGSHYETENDYQIIVYFRNPRERFDRVIGSVSVNTLNRLTD